MYIAIGRHITLCYLTGKLLLGLFQVRASIKSSWNLHLWKIARWNHKGRADWCTLYCSMGVHKQYSKGGQESGVNQIKMKHIIWLLILNDGAWVDFVTTRHLSALPTYYGCYKPACNLNSNWNYGVSISCTPHLKSFERSREKKEGITSNSVLEFQRMFWSTYDRLMLKIYMHTNSEYKRVRLGKPSIKKKGILWIKFIKRWPPRGSHFYEFLFLFSFALFSM